MTHVRRLLTVLAAAATAVAVAVPAGADSTSGGANQLVLVQTTSDGSALARAGTQVVLVGSPAVSSSNIATATASDCTGCHSTAVAVQVLLVTGNPSFFAPGNAAVATNAACTGCGSFAYARQFFLQTNGPAHLSAAGQQQVAALRQEISETASSILPSDPLTDPCPVVPVDPLCPSRDQQLKERLDALVAELQSVIAADVETGGTPVVSVTTHLQDAAGS